VVHCLDIAAKFIMLEFLQLWFWFYVLVLCFSFLHKFRGAGCADDCDLEIFVVVAINNSFSQM
jgi:hypothetical protein